MKTNGKIQLYPLLRIAIFMIVGIIAGDAISNFIRPSLWLYSLIGCLLLSFLPYKSEITQTGFLLLTSLTLGGYLISDQEAELRTSLPQNDQTYEGVIVSEPVVKEKTILCDIIITKSSTFPKPVKIKACFLKDKFSELLNIGDGIAACSSMETPKNYKSSTFDYRRFLMCHEFTAQTFIYTTDWRLADVNMTSLSLLQRTELAAMRFRQKLLMRYKAYDFNGQVYAIIAAMTLGDKSTLSKQTKDVYSITGASHVLALSGLHLGIIYSILTLLTFRRQKKLYGQIVILTTIWAFTILVGMSPSVVRSATMLSICSINDILGRSRFSLNTLGLTAIIMLICNPLNLFDVGFEMSFMAVLSILIFYQPIYQYINTDYLRKHQIQNVLWQIAVVSIAAQICTVPLVCYYFGRISCYFILTNLIVVSAAYIILGLSISLIVFSSIPTLPNLLAYLLLHTVKTLNATLTYIAHLPGSCIDGLSPSGIQIIMVYMIIISIYILGSYVRKLHRISISLNKIQ